MTKKKSFVALVIFLTLLLTACGGKKEPTPWRDTEYGKKYRDLTVQTLPTGADYQALSPSERGVLRMAMDEIPLADYRAYFEEAIAAYCASDAVPDSVKSVELVSMSLTKDELSVVPNLNKKYLDDLLLHVEFQLEPTDLFVDYSDVASYNLLALEDYLLSGSAAFKKVCDFEVKTTSEMGISVTAWGSGNTGYPAEAVFKEQPESEYAVQTLAFQFEEENNGFTLRKFGPVPEIKELYIEYEVSDQYLFRGLDSDPERLEKNIAKLPDVFREIAKQVMGTREARAYLKEQDLNGYTIVLRNENLKEGCMTFYGG